MKTDIKKIYACFPGGKHKALTMSYESIKIIQGKLKHNKKRFPIPGAFLQHVFGDLIPLIC